MTPAVAGDTVFAGSCAGVYYAFDLESGDVVWSHDFRDDVGHATFHGDPWLTSTAVVTGTESLDPVHTFALDRQTGDVVWRSQGEWALTLSDIVGVGDLVVGRNERGELVALDPENGEKVWHVEHESAAYRADVAESPAVLDSDVLFSAPDGVLYRVDGRSGVVGWRVDLGCDVTTSVAAHAEDVYVGCGTGDLFRLSASDGSIRGRLDLDQPLAGRLLLLEDRLVVPGGQRWIGAVDRSVERVLWARTDESSLSVVQPMRWRDAVLTGTGEGRLLALGLEDGRTLWTLDLEGSVRGLGKHRDILLVGTIQGTLYTFRQR